MNEEYIIQQLKVRWVSREELSGLLDEPSDRGVRKWIESLNDRLKNEHSCVLSTCQKRGYHIPNPYDEEDIRLVRTAVHELKNKAASIFARRSPLEDFLKYTESLAEAKGAYQLTLF